MVVNITVRFMDEIALDIGNREEITLPDNCIASKDSQNFKIVNCNECYHISLTEEQQERLGKYNIHHCRTYNKRVFHRDNHKGFNDYIYPCNECKNDDYERFSKER